MCVGAGASPCMSHPRPTTPPTTQRGIRDFSQIPSDDEEESEESEEESEESEEEEVEELVVMVVVGSAAEGDADGLAEKGEEKYTAVVMAGFEEAKGQELGEEKELASAIPLWQQTEEWACSTPISPSPLPPPCHCNGWGTLCTYRRGYQLYWGSWAPVYPPALIERGHFMRPPSDPLSSCSSRGCDLWLCVG